MRRLILSLFLCLPCAWAVAQNSPPSMIVGKTFVRPAAGALVVFTPPQAHTEFDKAEPMLAQALSAQLQALGYRAAMLDKPNFDQVWAQEVAAVGGVFDATTGALRAEAYASALAALGRRIAAETGAALVLMPKLVTRQAAFSGTKAVWDGQWRLIPTRGLAGDDAQFSGTVPALSVEVLAVTADGMVGFRTFGGASLPLRANFSSARHEIRSDLFDSADELAQGVALALVPLAGAEPVAAPTARN